MKLKSLLSLLFLTTYVSANCQDMASPVPVELKSLDYLIGNWQGSMAIAFGDQKSTFKATVEFKKVLGGRYVQGMHTYSAQGMPDMTGMALFSYSEKSKHWMGWWFDSAEAGTVEMTGPLKDGVMVLTSKPMEMQGMGMASMRSTWTKVSDTRLKLKVEMKQDQDWSTFIEADYSKK